MPTARLRLLAGELWAPRRQYVYISGSQLPSTFGLILRVQALNVWGGLNTVKVGILLQPGQHGRLDRQRSGQEGNSLADVATPSIQRRLNYTAATRRCCRCAMPPETPE